ncbi:Dihydroorotate dehydrogenase B (NAD(+)), electron transfer subunit [Paraburkholderia ultramafica]|uniref:Dihydroorotate dehydrogenase B (NAD(+)), electron transfer subunit n=1 Tax=Paraburkholderia ultramafica TaxID=1544867 RepID=A0A6S7BNA9_9BURK|nr:dihydroorotate dehydrogenase electron transfer subunit [Paraburkholderia ultramafica]CAB3806333.1 Dihydroorotate dehydrogenase B (NAD(+)), electron transfer subunit [Paraburkholderia ultramafica]
MTTITTDPQTASGDAPAARVIPLCSAAQSACATPLSIAENPCFVRSNDWVNAEYKHLVLSAPALALTARSGQFFHLACPASNDDTPYLRRPMSLYCVAPENQRIEFLYKVQGAGTRGLAQLAAGDTLDALGPLGKGFTLPDTTAGGHVLLLARGVGLATLAPLAHAAIAAGARVTAVLSARSPALMMSADYLRDAGANVIIVTDDEQTSDVVQVESLIRRVHAQQPITYASTCGSNRLLSMLQRVASQLGIPGEVALEQHMGCGIGACYACVRPFRKHAGSDELSYRRVCWDGPVFDLQETTSW